MEESKYIEKKFATHIINDLESSSDDSDEEYTFLVFLSLTRKYDEKVQIV